MTTAYEQLKAMGEACIGNTPKQVESLAKEVEWKNGDACIYNGNTAAFIGFRPVRKHLCVVEIYDYEGMSCMVKTVFVDELKKPESPQNKAKRENGIAMMKRMKIYYRNEG